MINKHLKPFKHHNSPHKFGFKFYMWAGDQKLNYNLEWSNLTGEAALHGSGCWSVVLWLLD